MKIPKPNDVCQFNISDDNFIFLHYLEIVNYLVCTNSCSYIDELGFRHINCGQHNIPKGIAEKICTKYGENGWIAKYENYYFGAPHWAIKLIPKESDK